MDLGDPTLELALLGWPGEERTLRLDYRRFSYAGKFVVGRTGKAVVRRRAVESAAGNSAPVTDADLPPLDEPLPPGLDADEFDTDVVAAVAFSPDRTDSGTLWLRYVTVRQDRRGEGLGPRLVRFVTDRAHDRGYDRVRIAVNNPFAYEALHKAGFAWTGGETGLAELVLEHPPPVETAGNGRAPSTAGDRDRYRDRHGTSVERYQAGLDRYRARDLDDPEASFLARKQGTPPPTVLVTDAEGTRETSPDHADDSGN
ncbi:GNAT family N-acetyltransferase [Salinirubrum litoreum]|uniref:GNAT family N-acetyltransferase n=1 Tax=Salinirubrum litoreum TaxID=1126234 RepID=A0ABD5R9Q2_9EURY|nr:GNAT family N-acetyltransferase [Salinirubrum litoreum]